MLNVDNDHMDCYSDLLEAQSAFKEFTKNVITVLNADDKNSQTLYNSTTVTFGIDSLATYMAKNLKEKNGEYSFTAYSHGIKQGVVNLRVLGKHNVYNALSTIAVTDLLKIPFPKVKKSLEQFNGVKRRNEYVGEFLGKKCYCDYAHHPREIGATIDCFNKSGNAYLTVFQPHTYSRTKFLMDEFISVLKDLNRLIIMDTYPARESFDKTGSAKTLYQNLQNVMGEKVTFISKKQNLENQLTKTLTPDLERILFLGAGDIYDKVKNILVQKNAKKV